MSITWKMVNGWREARGMTKADLARRAGIPERTIYNGVACDRQLQAAAKTLMRDIFPEEFKRAEEQS